MAKVRLDLTDDAFQRLLDSAVDERRPINLQAEVLIERQLGLRPIEAPSELSRMHPASDAASQREVADVCAR